MLLNNVFFLRVDRGLSRQQLADYIGCEEVSVWNWEHQNYQPSAFYIHRLMQFFHCSFYDLFAVLEGGDFDDY